jgi:uncharacterized protein
MNSVCEPATPWWRVGMVWLVIGGPLVVVVAAFVTLALAIAHPDPVLPREAKPASAASPSQAPAMEARNHAATGGR